MAAGQSTVPAGASSGKKITLKKTAPKPTAAQRRRAQRAAAARTRAAAQARILKEAQEPQFKLDELGALVPDVRAAAAIIYNPQTGKVLWESNSQDQRSIASITKVMTAVVFLEGDPDLSVPVVVEARRCPRRLDDVSARRRHGDPRRPAAPAPHRLRQRRRARAGAGVAARVARLHRPHEREGEGTGPRRTRPTPIRPACSPPTSRRPTTWPGSSPMCRATSASPRSCARSTTR